jgi:hypothetical protein
MDTASHPVSGDAIGDFYIEALERLRAARVPFLVGGAFAYARYTGIGRSTKDLDVFVRPEDVRRVLAIFGRAGYRASLPFPHWLGKVQHDAGCLDIVFNSGNGNAPVDDEWFAHAVEDCVLGLRLRLCPPEEVLWTKAFVQERERFDGAEVLHLVRARGATLDWERLLARFGDHWPVLLGHLALFGFVYPDRADAVPAWVTEELTSRLRNRQAEPDSRLCRGTLLSREQYLVDLELYGYTDARLQPHGAMSLTERAIWTQAIDRERRG